MLSSCIKYFILVHSVCATCKGGAKNNKACKATITSEYVSLVQHSAAKVNSTPRQRDQSKLDDETAFLQPVKQRESKVQVWISSFPRSASSTLLSLVRASAPEDDGIFTLFEPGHPQDNGKLPLMEAQFAGLIDAPRLAAKLAGCNFTDLEYLWGWKDEHTTNGGKEYSAALASNTCNKAGHRAFKYVGNAGRVDPGRLMKNFLWVLDRIPSMKILNLVRDPRSIMASWKATEPFIKTIKERDERGVPFFREACDTYAANLRVAHSQIFTVVYENLVQWPQKSISEIYNFLGFHFGQEQEKWVEHTFYGQAATDQVGLNPRYSDTHGHEHALQEMHKWRDVLNASEKEAFVTYASCQTVFKALNYPIA